MIELLSLDWAGTWAILAFILSIALLESLAIVGLLLPGVALLFFLAGIAAEKHIPFSWVLICATIGAFIGDTLSFLFGNHLKHSILNWPPLQKRPTLLKRAHSFCHQHGLKALLVGRFIGPLRPVIPITAGTLAFPLPSFFCISVIGAILWAPVYTGPGYFVGTWPGISLSFWLFIFLLFAIPEIMLSLQNRIASPNKKEPFYIICFLSITLILGIILHIEKSMMPLCERLCVANTQSLHWIHTIITQLPDNAPHFVLLLAAFFSKTANTLPVFCILGFIFWKLQNQKAFKTAALLLIATALPFILKTLFNIDRPPGGHIEITQSFPSGHTYFACLLVTCIHLFCHKKYNNLLRLTIYWSFAVALSRLILHVHWPLDILGGYLLALSMSCTLYLTYPKHATTPL